MNALTGPVTLKLDLKMVGSFFCLLLFSYITDVFIRSPLQVCLWYFNIFLKSQKLFMSMWDFVA